MIRIRLFCNAGCSTSMLVRKMEEAAEKLGIDVEIKACAQGKLQDNIDGIDAALLGPQVAYTLEQSREICAEKNVPIGVIPMVDYGTMNGAGVLDYALSLIEG